MHTAGFQMQIKAKVASHCEAELEMELVRKELLIAQEEIAKLKVQC